MIKESCVQLKLFTLNPETARIQKILSEGSNFDNVFFFILVNEGREDRNTTISGPSSVRQRNHGVLMITQAW